MNGTSLLADDIESLNMFNLAEIKKKDNKLPFDQELDIKEALTERDQTIIDIDKVRAQGTVSYEDGLYFLTYYLDYLITLPSSRSMEPVELTNQLFVSEVFIAEGDLDGKQELVDDDLVLVIEGDAIDLTESVIDNILLNIPLKVLTEEEEEDNDTLPSGQSWSVLTEEQYQALQEEKKEENNPFAALNGLFD